MKKISEFLIITIGTTLSAIGIYFFKFQNHFCTGGVSGISVILGALIPNISPGKFIMFINIAFLIVGFAFLGKGFTFKTIYCSLLMSFIIYILELFVPMNQPLTNQTLLELIFAVMFPAAGSAILFYCGASTGGTDIAAMLLKKYTSIEIGKALFFTDFAIAFTTAFIFGVETCLFSVLGLLAKSFLVDTIINSINKSKLLTIVTDFPNEILDYINVNIHRGATLCNCQGGYTSNNKKLLLTALNDSQAMKLNIFIKAIDPNAFVIVTNTSNVLGKGFKKQW